MSDSTHKVVLQEYRDFLLVKAPWERAGFLQALADNKVLLKTDIDDLQVSLRGITSSAQDIFYAY